MGKTTDNGDGTFTHVFDEDDLDRETIHILFERFYSEKIASFCWGYLNPDQLWALMCSAKFQPAFSWSNSDLDGILGFYRGLPVSRIVSRKAYEAAMAKRKAAAVDEVSRDLKTLFARGKPC